MDVTALRDRADRLARLDLDLDGVAARFDELLRPVTGHVVAAWSTVDPATGLLTSCRMSGLPHDPAREAALFEREYRLDEPATFLALHAGERDVQVLSEVTGGHPERAARFRDLAAPAGATDELRAVFRDADTVWGNITLYRRGGSFGAAETEAVGAITSSVVTAMRRAIVTGAAARPELVDDPPGVLLAGRDGTLTALTGPGERWLAVAGHARLSPAAHAIAGRLRAAGPLDGARARVRLDDGRWLTLHGSVRTDDRGAVAIVVERSRPAEVGEVLVRAYGLTARERDVLGPLLRGDTVTRIAGALAISPHTVADHLKSIHRKVGVASRAELAAVLYLDQYSPRSAARVPPSPYGWFLEA